MTSKWETLTSLCRYNDYCFNIFNVCAANALQLIHDVFDYILHFDLIIHLISVSDMKRLWSRPIGISWLGFPFAHAATFLWLNNMFPLNSAYPFTTYVCSCLKSGKPTPLNQNIETITTIVRRTHRTAFSSLQNKQTTAKKSCLFEANSTLL